MRRGFHRLASGISYANVVSTICLFAVLGGGAYAASHLPKNSVGSKQIKDNKVKGLDVRDGSLRKDDFASGQLPQGPRGAPGARGPSDAFQNFVSGGTNLGSAASPTTLASLSLPAGNYVVTGQATVDNASSTTGIAVCFLLRPGGTFFSVVREGLGSNTAFDDKAEPTAVGALNLPAAGTVSLSCGYDAGASTDMSAAERHLVAVQVGTLTGQ
jgi:hypothetical protein